MRYTIIDGKRYVTKSSLCQAIMISYENRELIPIDDSQIGMMQVHLEFERPDREILITNIGGNGVMVTVHEEVTE